MLRDIILYHPTSAPEGHEFETLSEGDLKAKVDAGWTDNPAKVGVNMWGHEGSDRAVALTKQAFESGAIKAIDVPGQPSPEYAQEMAQQLAKVEKQDAFIQSIMTQLTPEQRMRYAREMEADMESDAAKALRNAGGRQDGDPSRLEKDTTQQTLSLIHI